MTHYGNPPQPSGYSPFYPPPPQRPRRSAWFVLAIVGGVLILSTLIFAACVFPLLNDAKTPTATIADPTHTTAPVAAATTGPASVPSTGAPATTKAAPPPPPAKPTITGVGTFLVPSEVKPGTYRTVVPADGSGCYWARLKGLSGEITDVITSDVQDAGATVTVTIKPTDKAFKVDNECGTWTML